ncbi:hypothetical protein, partial [Sinorhizobium fredii]
APKATPLQRSTFKRIDDSSGGDFRLDSASQLGNARDDCLPRPQPDIRSAAQATVALRLP